MRTYDYNVGFAKPPKDHQFRKGQSGNPRGRKAKARIGLARTIENLLMEPVPVTDKGVARKAYPLELILMQLLSKVADGKGRAYRALCRYQAYARARPRPRSASRWEISADVYARLLEGEEVDLRPRRIKRPDRGKRQFTIDERIQRMRAGLEEIEIPEGANAKQSGEIYQMLLHEPPTRPAIRTPRSRKELFAAEIFDLALYSTLNGKFGRGAPPTRIVGVLRRLIMKAVGGDVPSAVLILDLHAYAEKEGDL